MTKEKFTRELNYQSMLAVTKQLLKKGVFTESEFLSVEYKLRSEFEPLIGSLETPNTFEKSLDV